MLRIEDADGVRCIGLDRPAKRNAIGVELTLALEEVLLRTTHDAGIHALVFHGIGGNFCAGMDMKDFFDSSTRPPDVLLQARMATEHWRTRLLPRMPQPIFTAVRGYCLGAAMPILNASQVVLASADARFGLPEINFGFVPGGQIVKAAGQMITPRGLAYAALSGRPFDAERAQRWGLVTRVVPDDPFEPALALARQAARAAIQAGSRAC
ncbi:enoyl-CoA hydratase/isomerase family protein [Bordetella genomosp. 13]|uniref:enoyl-CoA hydratase/isomerase family protein n=1 Tax=Bordetella genomosp. 13 TaxID=463040 RepID=UPI0011A9BAE3|nr:enoyl-CoA hydratase/isomerase family protein [Bordetella genomosp. 13]